MARRFFAKKPPAKRFGAKKFNAFKDRSKCRFCRFGKGPIDYKDVQTLSKLTTMQGKLFSRKRSGNCALHQRSARTAVKRARFIGLLAFTS